MAGLSLRSLEHSFLAEVSQRIHFEVILDLLKGHLSGDQLILGVGVDPVEAGMRHRRRTDPHVHLSGTGIP